MKTTILFLLVLIPLAATAALYDTLESCANMVEILLLPFTAEGKTAAGALVFGGPFLILFIAVFVAEFIAVPLAASALAACLGGWGLRQSGRSVSERSALFSIALAAAFTIAFVLVASQRDGLIPLSRPPKKPKTPAAVLACLAGGNAALSLFVATRILRRITSNRQPPPIPELHPTKVASRVTGL